MLAWLLQPQTLAIRAVQGSQGVEDSLDPVGLLEKTVVNACRGLALPRRYCELKRASP
jgi:hypothetical protein